MKKNFRPYWYEVCREAEIFIEKVRDGFKHYIATDNFNYNEWINRFFDIKSKKSFKLILGYLNHNDIELCDASNILSCTHYKNFDKSKWISEDPIRTLKIMAVEAYKHDLFKTVVEEMIGKILQPTLDILYKDFGNLTDQIAKLELKIIVDKNNNELIKQLNDLQNDKQDILNTIKNVEQAIQLSIKGECKLSIQKTKNIPSF